MGVHGLWKILDQKTVKKEEKLSALCNKKLCVDLSGWICEAQCTKELTHSVASPHLQTLLHRVLNLTRRGVKLVFVMDGKPPELKWETIMKRIQARSGEQSTGFGGHVGRSHFEEWAKECRTLLNLLGIPCIESEGEAEALCALLDLNQIVDGCITNDGDVFLYGARTVYKGLSISRKDQCVECYKMEDIENQLNLSRQNLVALGILLGCDYLPKGVSSVGKEKAMELIGHLKHDNLIDRFYEWTKETNQDDNLSSIEKSVKSKALQDKDFPYPKVIEEFLHPKVNVPDPETFSFENGIPDLQKLQEFCVRNLKWKKETTRKKVLPLLTYWQMTSLLQQCTAILVMPERIIKAQIKQAVEYYEVEWKNLELGEACPTSFVTIETKELFMQVYPDRVKEFVAKLAKPSKKSKSPIQTPRIDSIFKSVKKKEAGEQSKQQEADVMASSGGGQVVVDLEKPSSKKIKLTVDD